MDKIFGLSLDQISALSAAISALSALLMVMLAFAQCVYRSKNIRKGRRFFRRVRLLLGKYSNVLWSIFAVALAVFVSSLISKGSYDSVEKKSQRLESHYEILVLLVELAEEQQTNNSSNETIEKLDRIKKLVESTSAIPALLRYLGDWELQSGRYKEAINYYSGSIVGYNLNDSHVKAASMGMVIAYYRMDEFALAIKTFKTNLLPYDPSAKQLYSGAMAYSNKWEKYSNWKVDSDYNNALELYKKCQEKTEAWAPWCFYNEACLLSLRMSDPRSDRAALAEEALQRLERSIEVARERNPELVSRLRLVVANDDSLELLRSTSQYMESASDLLDGSN